jgi:hypothetical protein
VFSRVYNRAAAAAILAGLVALVALAGAASVGAVRSAGTPPRPAVTVNVGGEIVRDGICDEDEPCWDCRTMGNRVCGPMWRAPVTPARW